MSLKTVTADFLSTARNLRRDLGLSQQELADAMCKAAGFQVITRPIVANAEVARLERLGIDQAYAYADALGTTIDYLAFGRGPRCPKCNDAPPVGFRCMSYRREGF